MTVCAECGGPLDPDTTHTQHESGCDPDDSYCLCDEVCAACCTDPDCPLREPQETTVTGPAPLTDTTCEHGRPDHQVLIRQLAKALGLDLPAHVGLLRLLSPRTRRGGDRMKTCGYVWTEGDSTHVCVGSLVHSPTHRCRCGAEAPPRGVSIPVSELSVNGEQLVLLRRVLGEYVQGNQIIDGHWYSPDETGAPHYKNDEATPDELALLESLRTEVGL